MVGVQTSGKGNFQYTLDLGDGSAVALSVGKYFTPSGKSLTDVGGSVLVVSQFTLYGDCSHGRRPSFIAAARPEQAIPLYEQFLAECTRLGFPPQHGQFGAYMQVASVNDGPVTMIVVTRVLK